MPQAHTIYTAKTWQRSAWQTQPAATESTTGMSLFRLEVLFSYQGDLEGESIAHYLVMQEKPGTGSFVGLERVVGRLGDRAGSFVLERIGQFDNGVTQEKVRVIDGSGSEELTGLRVQLAHEFVGHPDHYPMQFDYTL